MLDLGWVLLPGKTQAARKSLAMRVDGYAGFIERMAQDYVGGFPSDTGEVC